MKFTVATNWDFNLIDEFAKYPVEDVYGTTPHNIVGGGRPSFLLPDVDEEKVAEYISKLHAKGIKFSYLMNAPCMNNMEYNADLHAKLLDQIQWVQDIGADNIVLTTPFLVQLVHEQFPSLDIRVSTIAHVNSVNRAKFFERMGAKEITVDMNINRDFKTLENMVKAVKCKINLLLTDGCLYQCPFRYYHYNILGHASQTYQQFNREYLDFCIVNCSRIKFSDKTEVMKCRWVRPEDLKEYEAIGIDHFKIAGRRMSSSWILRSLHAFSNREYKGNLVDIIQGFSMSHGGLHEKDPAHGMADQLGKEGQARIYIDNTKLDGFIDFFKKQNCIANCGTCKYCEEWGKKVVIYNEEDARRYVESLESYIKDITTSKVFGLGENDASGPATGSTTQEDGGDGVPENWNPATYRVFEKLILNSPPQFQSLARVAIGSLAESKARERGSAKVEDEDMIAAFLEGTPGPFQPDMRAGLAEHGFKVPDE